MLTKGKLKKEIRTLNKRIERLEQQVGCNRENIIQLKCPHPIRSIRFFDSLGRELTNEALTTSARKVCNICEKTLARYKSRQESEEAYKNWVHELLNELES